MSGLGAIGDGVRRGYYQNAYEFGKDIRELLIKARDGHVNWGSPCFEYTFGFFHDCPIVALDNETTGEQNIFTLGMSNPVRVIPCILNSAR